MARWWPMEKLERSGRLVEHAQAVARRLGFEVRRCRDRRRVGREHDVGDGRRLDRRARADRRDGPLARRVPRGRLDRAADGAARRAAAGDRARPGRRAVARPPARSRSRDRRSPARSPPAARGRRAGYSRAVVVGDSCWVAGTTDAGPDGRSLHPGDAAAQARAAFGIVDRALEEAGFAVERRRPDPDVRRPARRRGARSRRVHGEVFGSIRPAATLVEVARPDRSVAARRGRAGGSSRLTGRRIRAVRPPAPRSRSRRQPARPRNRFCRQATSAMHARDRQPRQADDEGRIGRRSVATMTLTAASAARTAGPTSWR